MSFLQMSEQATPIQELSNEKIGNLSLTSRALKFIIRIRLKQRKRAVILQYKKQTLVDIQEVYHLQKAKLFAQKKKNFKKVIIFIQNLNHNSN